ncbi:MAG: DndE family protein [Fastidiosipilaceae bacterium]|jgi:DNA sulfur modification protein DndE|nr:DndE family protein [Clostridiaceae bacterium]
MSFKLKTSKNTETILNRIETSENLPWYALVKLSMALSINGKPLKAEDFKTNSLGRELNRQTITGEADELYKCLIELKEGRHLTDDEFFPHYVKAHIDRGADLLDQEQRYSSDFLVHLTELEKSL